jgi:Flp pilus assembly protein TadG
MLTRTSQAVRRSAWPENATGIAAVEFALATPIVLILMLCGFDVGRFALASQRVEVVANETGQIVAQTAASQGTVEPGDGVISDTQLTNAEQAAAFIFPEALIAAGQQGVLYTSLLQVNITSLKFVTKPTGCSSGCTYVPEVVWTTGNRPCNTTFTQVADASTPSPTTLPTDIYSPNSEIVVDVTYNFKPTFGSQWLSAVTIARSYYVSPRNVNIVETSGSALAPTCSGVL